MDKEIPDGSYTESQSQRTIIRVTSGVPQGSALNPLLFLAYIIDIWKNTGSAIILFTDCCVIYREIVNNNDVERLQTDLGRLGEWGVENGMKINPGKCKAVSFTRAQVNDLLNYSLLDQVIQEASSCKYLGIMLHRDFSWTEHVNYTAKEAWKALHFTMRILNKGNINMILEYGAACWDPFREGQTSALEWVQKKEDKFANLKNNTNWEKLAQH